MARLDMETRRGQLIDAAIRIAVRDGLDNTTVRRIATEADVSLGTVHYCFDSKRALLEAVVETLLAREINVDEMPETAAELSPADAVKTAFRLYWNASGAQTDFQRLTYELVAYLVRQEDPGPELARRIFSRNYQIVEEFISLFADEWSVRFDIPAPLLARLVVAMTDGVALAWLADNDEAAALEVLDTFSDLLTSRLVEAP